jgi:hypothetical protein
MENEKKYWLDDSRNVDKVFWALCILCALLALLDFFYHRHVEFSWEAWAGFYGFYGFVACVGLVLTAKQIRKIVKREDSYYDH